VHRARQRRVSSKARQLIECRTHLLCETLVASEGVGVLDPAPDNCRVSTTLRSNHHFVSVVALGIRRLGIELGRSPQKMFEQSRGLPLHISAVEKIWRVRRLQNARVIGRIFDFLAEEGVERYATTEWGGVGLKPVASLYDSMIANDQKSLPNLRSALSGFPAGTHQVRVRFARSARQSSAVLRR
jgi:hypothetical protein